MYVYLILFTLGPVSSIYASIYPFILSFHVLRTSVFYFVRLPFCLRLDFIFSIFYLGTTYSLRLVCLVRYSFHAAPVLRLFRAQGCYGILHLGPLPLGFFNS